MFVPCGHVQLVFVLIPTSPLSLSPLTLPFCSPSSLFQQASQSASEDLLAEKDAYIADLQTKLQTKTKVGAGVSLNIFHMSTHMHNGLV